MTALNVFVTPQAVHIATDGAGYLMDGRPFGQGQKVALLGHLPAVVAVRGASAYVHMLGAAIGAGYAAFDDLLIDAPELFRGVRRQYRREMQARGLADIAPKDADFVVAGFSRSRGRLEAYGMQNRRWNGGEPWTLIPIPELLLSPCDPQIEQELERIIDQIGDPLRMPESAAVMLLEAQRQRPFATESGAIIQGVGGFAQFTTVTADGISTRVLRRWPEKQAA